jgi:hypothetical protein
MRRWVTTRVGVDSKGKTNDALLLYDYLQPPAHGEFKGDTKEHQLLGYMMIILLRLLDRCDIPMVSGYQLNRTALDRDDSSTLSNSDRVGQKVANATILKRKDENEIAEFGAESGTSKFIPIFTRHGELLAYGDYINLVFDGRTATLTEGKTRNELSQERPSVANKVEPFKTNFSDELREDGDGAGRSESEGGRDNGPPWDTPKSSAKKSDRSVPNPQRKKKQV